VHDNASLNCDNVPSYFMDSRKESFHSTTEHHADGNATSLLEDYEVGGIHKQILFRSVRFWSVFDQNDSWEVG
jgi:hypothetical protein